MSLEKTNTSDLWTYCTVSGKYVAKKRSIKKQAIPSSQQLVIEAEVALGGVGKLTERNSLKYSEHGTRAKWKSTSSMAIWQVERLIEINDVSGSGHCRSLERVSLSQGVCSCSRRTHNRAVRGISHVRLLPSSLVLWDLNKHSQGTEKQ